MNRILAWFAVCLCAAACSGTHKPEASSSAKAMATSQGDACGHYAQRLCTELGTRSDSCRAVLAVLPLMSPRACEAGLSDFDLTLSRIAELRKTCEQVADAVCAELGPDSEGCQAIRQNLPQIPPGHCASLRRDQDQLLAALRQRQALNAPVSDERWAALLAGQPASFGAAEAKVVVVEFSDFQCPYCAQAASTVHRLREQYENRIHFVFRHFPLSFHPDARSAAQAALAAQAQGKFWEYHDLLFGHQGELGADALLDYARKLGLDLDAFRAASQSAATAARIADDVKLGESVQVQGTPTLFVDKQRIDDPLDYDVVSHAVDQA
ncbi:MAG: thioredoxin domain-containing protein, partial [Polyangiales bacterium]